MTEQQEQPKREPLRQPKPEPVRRRGEPFFDDLVGRLFVPATVRLTLHGLVADQYDEAGRIQKFRVWGGAREHGNDRYGYSLEQQGKLVAHLPGAEMLRPSQSLLYGIADALVYPCHFGPSADDCPTTAIIDLNSAIQRQLARGQFYETPTLFDPEPGRPRTVTWLLFSGNHLAGGPLSAYLALPGGLNKDGRIEWQNIEPLLHSDGGETPNAAPVPVTPAPLLPPQPDLRLTLRE